MSEAPNALTLDPQGQKDGSLFSPAEQALLTQQVQHRGPGTIGSGWGGRGGLSRCLPSHQDTVVPFSFAKSFPDKLA